MGDDSLYQRAVELRSMTSVCSLPGGSWHQTSRQAFAGVDQLGRYFLYAECRRTDHDNAWKRNLVEYRDSSTQFYNSDGILQPH